MTTAPDPLPGWTFDIEEVSAGRYEGVGRSESGFVVRRSGTNFERLEAELMADAREVEKAAHRRYGSSPGQKSG